VSRDQGETWKKVTLSPTSKDGSDHASVTYVSGNRVYVGTELDGGRFAISNDKGETWPVNVSVTPRQGDPNAGYGIQAIHATNGRTYIGTYRQGVGISEDDGKTWRFVNSAHGLAADNVNGIAGVGDKVYVSFNENDKISISEDGGKTWRIQDTNPDTNWVSSVAAVKDKVYVSHLLAGLSVSSDGGKTWSEKSLPNGKDFASEVVLSGDNVYVGTELGLYISHDGGDTWESRKLEKRWVEAIAVQCV